MSNPARPAQPPGTGPTIRQMLALWAPLAASIAMMVLEPSIINIGLGRTSEPEVALAAYGLAMGLAMLIEAPIMMLLDTSVARSVNREAFAIIRRITVILGLLVVVLGVVVPLTPLYDLIVVNLMNIPADIAARARPTQLILAFWPLPIAWRRAHQGALIRAGHTAIITTATGIRLVALTSGIVGGLLLFPEGGAIVAGVAMDLSVTIEAAVITVAALRVLRSAAFDPDPALAAEPPTLGAMWRFYRPLAMTTILRQFTRPMLSAGIAAALMPRASLAAWPVAWGLAILITGPAWSLQQLTTALVSDRVAYRRVRNFALILSTLLSLLFALVAFTPLYGWVMGQVYNLSPELQKLALPATQALVILPLLMGAQSLLRGILIRTGRTSEVRAAMTLNIGTLAATLVLGAALFSPTGTTLAALAALTGTLAELAWLRSRTRE